MEFVIALILGICIGLLIGVLIGQECVSKPDVNHQVDELNSQAHKHLDDLQETQKQIHIVSLKADVARRGIKSKISELTEQE